LNHLSELGHFFLTYTHTMRLFATKTNY
jgi:hypothetical protein